MITRWPVVCNRKVCVQAVTSGNIELAVYALDLCPFLNENDLNYVFNIATDGENIRLMHELRGRGASPNPVQLAEFRTSAVRKELWRLGADPCAKSRF